MKKDSAPSANLSKGGEDPSENLGVEIELQTDRGPLLGPGGRTGGKGGGGGQMASNFKRGGGKVRFGRNTSSDKKGRPGPGRGQTFFGGRPPLG